MRCPKSLSRLKNIDGLPASSSSVSCFLCSCTTFCLSSAVLYSALLERSVAMLESWAETGAGLLKPGYSLTRELCDDFSWGQSYIFNFGHRRARLWAAESLTLNCTAESWWLGAWGTGPVARAGTLVTPRAALRLVTSLLSVTTLLDVTWLCLLLCDQGHGWARASELERGTDDILTILYASWAGEPKSIQNEPTEQAETLFYLRQRTRKRDQLRFAFGSGLTTIKHYSLLID